MSDKIKVSLLIVEGQGWTYPYLATLPWIEHFDCAVSVIGKERWRYRVGAVQAGVGLAKRLNLEIDNLSDFAAEIAEWEDEKGEN